MNTSMMDTYNLGWKVAHVLKHMADPDILSTYQTERHMTAVDLINNDKNLSHLFNGRPRKDELDAAGISAEDFEKGFKQQAGWASGRCNLLGSKTAPAIKPHSQMTLHKGSPW